MQYIKLFPNEYPFLLKQLKMRPPHMYISGAPIPNDENKFLCVVGARKHSDYGKQACEELIYGLRNYPIVIVSGLALGIDSIAHVAALKNGLRTIALPGSGLEDSVIYPREHFPLAQHIVKSGNTLLSSFDPFQGGDYWTFPVRNQLMAGISHAVLIVEGRKGSGTLLTAGYAADLGRDVMIVPGSIFSDLSYGPHTLYSDGARPVMCSEDILEILGFDVRRKEEDDNDDKNSGRRDDKSGDRKRIDRTGLLLDRAFRELPDDQKVILRELQYKPCTSGELIEKFGISAVQFSIIATRLELYGIVTESEGMYRIAVK
jgi:DNA processing protein